MTLNPSLFSLPILKWLRSYHVTDDIIYKYHIGETSDNSLIMPVIDNDTITMFQQRWFNPRRIITHGSKAPFIAKSGSSSNTIVIVEDFISCIRVGSVVDSYCMFGTSIPIESLQNIISRYDVIVVWADGDAPGQLAAKNLRTKLESLATKQSLKRSFSLSSSKDIVNVLTSSDPKYYTNTQIRDIINNTTGEVYEAKN
jgi:hypothetical protein